MSSIEIKKVSSRKDLKAFVDFHYDLYENCPYDVPTLFSDDMNTLSPEKNAAFDFCDAEYYLAFKDGKLAGRVAAIINKRANQKWGRQSVRFGWIDFIDDIEVSKALLKAVEDFGRRNGMKKYIFAFAMALASLSMQAQIVVLDPGHGYGSSRLPRILVENHPLKPRQRAPIIGANPLFTKV